MELTGKGTGLANIGGGTIEANEYEVIIRKKNGVSAVGGLAGMAVGIATRQNGEYSMPYESIVSVTLARGGLMSSPYIQVLTAGESSAGSVEVATSRPNCILFKKGDLPQFEEMKQLIEQKARAARQRPIQSMAPLSLADELTKLSKLRDENIISEEDFNKQKAKLLG
jgi:hypothetical protein